MKSELELFLENNKEHKRCFYVEKMLLEVSEEFLIRTGKEIDRIKLGELRSFFEYLYDNQIVMNINFEQLEKSFFGLKSA